MKQHLIRICLIALGAVVTVSHAIAQQPCQPPQLSTQPAAQNIFSESQEMDLGDAVAQHLQRSHRVIDDEAVTAYLRRIGDRLTKHLPKTNLRFQFFLFDINSVNAFTLPGGRIYVSRKMVAFAQSEDELAGVIAHELGHIIARHSTIDSTILFREVLGVNEVKDRRDIFEKYNQLIENSARKPKALEKLQNHEEGNQNVADLIGLYALVQAGYDAEAQASLWDRYFDLKGKTSGGFLSDLFGRTKPEQKRLREMLKGLESLPAECRGARNTASASEFRQWQSAAVSYTGLAARKESLPGLSSRKELTPFLRSDINVVRFSPDGKFLLAQDDSGITVLSREPLAPVFRIDSTDAKPAQFAPDSRSVTFWTPNMRVEVWDVAEQKLKTAHEVVVRKKCLQTSLSPDGKVLACLDSDYGLNLFEVATGATIMEKKGFTQLGLSDFFSIIVLAVTSDDADIGNYEFVNMAFSPDGRYFLAGDRGVVAGALGFRTDIQSLAFDLTTRTPVSMKGDLKEIVSSEFAFVGPGKVAGSHLGNVKKSGLYTFPEGQTVANFEVFGNLWPVTSGNWLLLRRAGKYSGGLMDLDTKNIMTVNQRPSLDAYGDVIASEQRNGTLALIRMQSLSDSKVVTLPKAQLGRLYAFDLTPDFRWLAVSGYSRGAVWDLQQDKMVLALRGFRGAFLAEDESFYADFPKEAPNERNVARLGLTTRDAVAGPTIENSSTKQHGKFLVQFTPAKKGGSYSQNVVMDVKDATTNAAKWSLSFPQERPRYWTAPRDGTMTLLWPVSSKAAAAAIKESPKLAQQLKTLNEKEGDYFLRVLNVNTGAAIGELLLETGKGSFRITEAFTTGDWVSISDNENRTLVYSLSSGEQKTKVFGRQVAVSAATNLICVENGDGILNLYDMSSNEQRKQFTFPARISFARFSENGQQLFVLTADQTVYILNVSSQPDERLS